MTPENILELQEIFELKYRYTRALDTRDWDLLESCFTENIVLWPGGGDYIARGRDHVMQLIKSLCTDTFFSSHIVTQPEITFDGAERARGLWRLQDTIFYTAPHAAVTHVDIKGGEMSFGAAYYHDEYLKINGKWQISGCGFVRIYEAFRKPGQIDLDVRIDERRGLLKGDWPQ